MNRRQVLARVLWFVLSFPFAYAIAILLGLLFNTVFHTAEKTVWFIIPVSLVIAFFLMRLVVAISKKRYRRQAIVFKSVLVLCAVLSVVALLFDRVPDETVRVEMCLFDAPFKCADFGLVGDRISARLISAESVQIMGVAVEMASGKTKGQLVCIDGCNLMMPAPVWAEGSAREFSIAIPGVQEGGEVEILVTIALDRDGMQEEVKGSVLVYP